METTQSLIKDYKNNVLNSYPSIYTKDDVVHLLELLSQEIDRLPKVEKPLLEIDIEEFKEDVIDKVERILDNYDFEDNVELEVRHREIFVSFDSGNLMDEIRDDISEYFDKSELHKLITPKEYV
jgi:predicted RNA-binding protein Jag